VRGTFEVRAVEPSLQSFEAVEAAAVGA
jgi:hypothetical protein